MKWIILKQNGGRDLHTFGPVSAPTAEEAIRRLCEGEGRNEDSAVEFHKLGLDPPTYVPTKRGRYHAIPLGIWQDGTFDYTKTRGTEPVNFS